MVTLSQAVAHTTEHRWSRQRSVKDSVRNAGACVRYLGTTTAIVDITTKRVRTMVAEMLRDGVSNATINRRLAALSGVLKDAHRDGDLPAVPWLPTLKEGEGRTRVFTPEEEEAVVSRLPRHYQRLATFLVNTGARVSEALDLTWEDVKPDTVFFRETKNDRSRVVPLTVAASSTLTWARVPPTPFWHCKQSTFNTHFAAARDALGLQPAKECVPHALRHTFASRLVARGVALDVVSRLLGHSTLQMTMRYAHCNMDTLEKAMGTLE